MCEALKGNPINADGKRNANTSSSEPAQGEINTEDIKFAYCTEFILESDKVTYDKIKDIMLDYGDSLAVVGDDGLIKVHVHTNEPGTVLQEALKYGQLVTIKIENMKVQHENILIENQTAVSEEPMKECVKR